MYCELVNGPQEEITHRASERPKKSSRPHVEYSSYRPTFHNRSIPRIESVATIGEIKSLLSFKFTDAMSTRL